MISFSSTLSKLLTPNRLLTFVFLFTLSFGKSQTAISDKFHLHGKVKNPTEKLIIIKNNFFETTDSILLDDKNEFDVELSLESNYNFFCYGSDQFRIYFKNGCDIQIDFDGSQYPNSLTFSGDGSAENRYMMAKRSFKQQKNGTMDYSYYAMLEETDFIKYNFNLDKERIEFLKSSDDLSPDFKKIEKQSLQIDTYSNFANYQSRRQMMLNDNSFMVSDNYLNPFNKVSLNAPELLRTYNYQEYVHLYIDAKAIVIADSNLSLDFFVLYLQELSKPRYDQKIKDRLAFKMTKTALVHSTKLEEYYSLFLDIVKNQKYREIVISEYNIMKTEVGKPSEDFNFVDINGKPFSLKDFNGKYLYIDIWATWCRPCIKEIPNIEKLEEEFGDKVSFLSIAFRDGEKPWKEMVISKNMKGYQLFGADAEADFFQFYKVKENGLPRFILLDKEGKIIASKAKRPSDPLLKELLSKL